MTFPPLPPSTTLATVRSEPPPGPPFGLAGLAGLTGLVGLVGLAGLEGPLLAALGLVLLLGAHRHVAPNCRPDQILVIAGRGRRRRDGQRIGYRVVHGGRALMVPWLEHRRWMDVRPPTYRWVQPDAADSTTPPPARAPAKAPLAGGHG